MKNSTFRHAPGKVATLLAMAFLLHCAGPATSEDSGESAPGSGEEAGALLDRTQFALADAPSSDWVEPEIIRQSDESNPVILRIDWRNGFIPVGDLRNDPPQRVRLRSYFSNIAAPPFVGPTLRFKAGDQLYVQVINDLPAEPDCDPEDHHKPCFNDTNLHTHGLHISPGCHDSECRQASDNVLLNIRPTQQQQFRFDILPAGSSDPWKHYPGTFWYHAHRHGSTAVQLASGMAGALILEDPDEIPEIKGITERVMILQQLAFDNDGEVKSLADVTSNWNLKPVRHTTINGLVRPRIPMRPNEVQRWRVIDAGIFEMVPIQLVRDISGRPIAQPMQLIAVDGITIKKPRSVRVTDMGPGYRRDFLVKAPARMLPGEKWELRKNSSAIRFVGVEGEPDRQILAEIVLAGNDCATDPECVSELLDENKELPYPLPDIEEVDGYNRTEFSIENPGDPPLDCRFRINGRCFESKTVHPEFQLKANDVQEWTLSSKQGAHPFHIHVNAFQMLDAQGNPGDWHDTIIVPAAPAGQPPILLKMRTRYETFTGRFVLHCHILHHEDLGMMQLVEIK